MTDEGDLGSRVWVETWRAHNGLHMSAGGRGEEWQECVKSLCLGWLERSKSRNQATGCHSQKSGSFLSVILSLEEREGAEAEDAAATAAPMTLANQACEKAG